MWLQAVTCAMLQPMMFQVDIHLILHQITPLQDILHQINLMRFDVWYKGLQQMLDILGQNRLRSKGWPRPEGDQGVHCVDGDCRRHRRHQQGAEDHQVFVASYLLGDMHKHPGEEVHRRGHYLRGQLPGAQIILHRTFRTCQGLMTDPDLQGPWMDLELQRCHNDLESLPMIAMNLSD